MKSAKIFIIFTFLLAFALQVSAQDEKPKIVWKNVQEKYESFYDIKPTIFNASDKPIYVECQNVEPNGVYDGEYFGIKMTENRGNDVWLWNIFVCGTGSKPKNSKREKQIEKLRKQEKYTPEGCEINPNEEFTYNFSRKNWNNILDGYGLGTIYKSGKFRFEVSIDWGKDYGTIYSPPFFVTSKENK